MLCLGCGDADSVSRGEPWHKLRNDDLSDVELDGFSPELVDLIANMMRHEAGRRPSMEAVCGHGCVARAGARMTRAVESARAAVVAGTAEATDVFRASPFGSEGPGFLQEVLGRGGEGESMDTS